MHGVAVEWSSRDGRATGEGVLGVEEGVLILRYQTRDWHHGAQHSTARELRVAAGSVSHAHFGHGLFWAAPWIELQITDFEALATLDAEQSGRLRFRVRGSPRRAAKALVAELDIARAEVQFKRWNREMEALTGAAAKTDRHS